MDMDRWLRMGAALEIASLSRPTLRKYCEDGRINAKKLPGRGDWRISEKSLRDFLDGDKFALEQVARLGL